MLERVQKILASAGVASRRKCEDFIRAGRVFVNGVSVELGSKADAKKDVIKVDGQVIKVEKKVYLLLNKPRGYITTVSDEFGRKSVMDLIDTSLRVFPVGRLDRDASGLLLLTNDGLLANHIMHPRYGVEKTYVVRVREKICDEHIAKLKAGVFIDGFKVVPSRVSLINRNCVEIVLHEGMKHVVKRIFFKLGFFVVSLTRTRIANLSVAGLKEGRFRELSQVELSALRRLLNIPN